jgi:hypothetical protein
MSTPYVITVSVAATGDVPLTYGQTYQFTAAASCIICFTKNPLFVGITGATKSFGANGTWGSFVAPSQTTSISFNTVPADEQCTVGLTDTTRTIHVSSTTDKHGSKK